MVGPLDSPRDGLVTFLPHRLNRHPVVVRGLTADELWVCAGLSAAAGFVAGVPLAWLTHGERGAKHPRKRLAVNGGARRGSLFRGLSREVDPNQRAWVNRSG